MDQFVELLNRMRHKPPDRLLAVHCRGGKGRTGSMCCAWLLYSRQAIDAEDALTHFALERTDLSQVSCPSLHTSLVDTWHALHTPLGHVAYSPPPSAVDTRCHRE